MAVKALNVAFAIRHECLPYKMAAFYFSNTTLLFKIYSHSFIRVALFRRGEKKEILLLSSFPFDLLLSSEQYPPHNMALVSHAFTVRSLV